MAKSKRIYFYIAANLAFLIPVPGRFAYALIMTILFLVQMATTTLYFHAIHRMKLGNMQNALLALTIISLGVFFKQLIIIICPVAALTLGFCIFLPTLASVIIEFFFLDYEHGIKSHLIDNIKKSLCISLFSLIFFLMRDLFGYGTLTLPGWKKIVVLRLPFDEASTGASVFLATIPGGLALMAILLALYIFVMNKFRIIENSCESSEEDK